MRESNRYRREDNFYCIDIVLHSLLQLFDGRDPSPFKERDLDEDFSRYLILASREIGGHNPIKLVIKMQDHTPTYLKAIDIETAIFNYFSFEWDNSRNELAILLKQGRGALLMGLIFLAACYTGFYFIKEDSNFFLGFFGESLHVLGWVAMWKPINLFLYEWWPIRDRMKLMSELKKIKVEIVTG